MVGSHCKKMRCGVLLVNIGTPDAPRTKEVRKYLRQFLSDPRVLDISPIVRAFVLNLMILPFRSAKSASAYRIIWTDKGSPITVCGEEFTRRIQKRLDEEFPDRFTVKLAMRYGSPSIEQAMDEFQSAGIGTIRVFPLYPQYASATVGSTMEEVFRVASKYWNVPNITTLPLFYDHPRFIKSFADVARENIDVEEFDHFLFSFHGLPERHIIKSDLSHGKYCLAEKDCCTKIGKINSFCYRAHCYATARLISQELGLSANQYTVSFQSRLGRDPWLKPYTDVLLETLPKRGIKRLAIFSPAFVADCLETIEELGIRGAKDFLAAGGEKCVLVPSLNLHPTWIETAVDLIVASDLPLQTDHEAELIPGFSKS